MRLLTYRKGDRLALGVKTDQGILDVEGAAKALGVSGVTGTPEAFYAAGLAALGELEALVRKAVGHSDKGDWMLEEAGLRYGPCVPNPEKILCVGLNYRRHAAESGAKVPEVPVLFSKFNNALTAHGEAVKLVAGASEYDYEVELGVVIGKRVKGVDVAHALECVLGYCNANDLSARDLQRRTTQWLLGKTLDGFCPIGPYTVTADEAGDPQQMATRSWLNGELRQNTNTADMVFSVAEVISYASRYMTLRAGDIILTGTPEGVILGMKDKVWMKPGDEVTIEVGNLGRLTNRMEAE